MENKVNPNVTDEVNGFIVMSCSNNIIMFLYVHIGQWVDCLTLCC